MLQSKKKWEKTTKTHKNMRFHLHIIYLRSEQQWQTLVKFTETYLTNIPMSYDLQHTN